MQIIGGRFRGKKLVAPEGTDVVRPTAARAREAVFNILLHGLHREGFTLAGATVADLFCGTGALGLEALSRGAQSATFVDRAPTALAALKRNIRALPLDQQTQVIAGDVLNLPRAMAPFSLIFMDPPYAEAVAGTVLQNLATNGWVKTGSIVVVETATSAHHAYVPDFQILKERRYGKAMTRFLLYRPD
ncbi:16S rRNA (guanine(966)-N(2))-methyltransferase RsmD [Haematospirillum sp. 15-248]|uniref:16S rRNA (guanine(966)-N(2))-methyltransferase RsmD n=1 Tax=Haematospirillum sp. 15-248 TaxID=2723107 RepID=UPI00143A05FE|nr:16S rRNA (guanine(966)-N(2))-methyltransferase RsmD [Haematospirillum sp. 15-248]NKD87723.1 16S rRNA (guanine(966)-N(2))-methyltransferase RsmD [Haematospirillum sp. 15-248]